MAVPFTTLTLDKDYKLRFGMGAMIQFEKITGLKLMALDLDDISVEVMARILWLALKYDAPTLTFEDAMRLIDEHLTFTEALKIITDTITAAMPSGENPNVTTPTENQNS